MIESKIRTVCLSQDCNKKSLLSGLNSNLASFDNSLNDIFFKYMQQGDDEKMLIDFTNVSEFDDIKMLKRIKIYLPDFTKNISLKVSNIYRQIISYALGSGFEFEQANSKISILKYSYIDSQNQIYPNQSQVYNPKLQDSNEIIITYNSNDLRVPHANSMDDSFLKIKFSEEESKNYRQSIQKLNLNKTSSELFSNKSWNIDYYNKNNYPVVLGKISETQLFSHKKMELDCVS